MIPEKDKYRGELLWEGKRLFTIVVNELNSLDTHGRHRSYRREEDHEEICMALALLARSMGMSRGDS